MFSKRISLREASRSLGTPSALASIQSRNVQKETAFDFADKQLEFAQSLCEAAAHQVLRSGDCATELENIQEKFKLVLETAESEVERLTEEKKQEEKRQEEKKLEKKKLGEKKLEETKLEEGKVAETPKRKSAEKPVVLAGDKPPDPDMIAIEVDDSSSGSSISIDISAFRSTRFG
jgi:hypothetical protein